jgi:hypothetical protein
VPAPAYPDVISVPTIRPSGVRNSNAAVARFGRPMSASESPGLSVAVKPILRL